MIIDKSFYVCLIYGKLCTFGLKMIALASLNGLNIRYGIQE